MIEAHADLKLTNADGATATIVAIVNDRLDFAKELLDLGADPNDGSLYFAVDMALATDVLVESSDVGKDLGVINSADVLPQSIGPAFAPLLLAIGSGHNYTVLYLATMLTGLMGALTVTHIKAAR